MNKFFRNTGHFFGGLVLAPFAPVLLWLEWLTAKDHEYLPSAKKWLIFERVIKSLLFIGIVIFLISYLDSLPSSIDEPEGGEACFPYGDCY